MKGRFFLGLETQDRPGMRIPLDPPPRTCGRRLATVENPGHPRTDPPKLVCDPGDGHLRPGALLSHPAGGHPQRRPGVARGPHHRGAAVRLGASARARPLPGGDRPGGAGAQHHPVPAGRCGQRRPRMRHRPRLAAGGRRRTGGEPGVGHSAVAGTPRRESPVAGGRPGGARSGCAQPHPRPVQPVARPAPRRGPDPQGPGVAGHRQPEAGRGDRQCQRPLPGSPSAWAATC